jgi:alkanesulfonate monooxygenase SsuD/methylene tetrahydromethanopterin reductase-like flavin-dependent oxidoreductase (luciferase family)
MKAGVFMYPQNRADLERFVSYEDSADDSLSVKGPDTALWEEELRLGDLVEPLGFDEMWTVEHHFSPYAMITNPLQYLTFWAGRTERLGFGTMVVVLPWHHPLRVAEDIVMLQHMLGERDLSVGFGRGVSRREYGGLNIPQTESRERFDEAVQVIQAAVTQERFSHQGKFFTIPDVSQRPQSPHLSLRPQPRDGQRLADNFHGAWGSPQSAIILARLGLKPLIIPQRTFFEYQAELAAANAARVEIGLPEARPTVAVWTVCLDTEAEAFDVGHRANTANFALAEVNYELSTGYHQTMPGYEHYGAQFEELKKAALGGPAGEGGVGGAADGTPYADMPQGTPDQCIKAIQAVNDLVHPKQWLFGFKFGGMPYEVAERSIKLFAKEVLPFVHELPEPELSLAST